MTISAPPQGHCTMLNVAAIEDAIANIREELLDHAANAEPAAIARHAKTILLAALRGMAVPEKDIAFLTDQIDFNIDWGGRI